MNDKIVKVIILISSFILILILAVIIVGIAMFFDFKDQTLNGGQKSSISQEGSDVCNGIKIKFKNQEVPQSVVDGILKTVGAAEGNYNPQNGLLFIPLKDKCDKLSATLAASSLRNVPEIDYVTPVFLSP